MLNLSQKAKQSSSLERREEKLIVSKVTEGGGSLSSTAKMDFT
jgi:hypothetical protein